MARNNDDISLRQLMMEKLAGIIGEEDDILLQNALQQSSEANQLWQELRDHFYTDTAANALQRVDEVQAWKRMSSRLHAKQSKLYPLERWFTMAAAASIVFIVGYFYLKLKSTNEENRTVAEKNGTGIKLKLASGAVFDLSKKGEETIQAGPTQLYATTSGLSYKISDKGMNQWNTLFVPSGMSYKVQLSDGSQIWLNSSTKFEFPFAFPIDKREVRIEGEAYFMIAKNSKQPFIVHTGATSIRVLGTEFNVNTYDSFVTKTALVTGSIATNGKNGKTIKLTPGYQAIYKLGNGFTIQPFDDDILAWRSGLYYYHNTSLAELAKVIERWYGVKVTFENSCTASRRVTGVLDKNRPLRELLHDWQKAIEVRTELKNGILHFL